MGPVATFEQWKKRGRYVRKGEKALAVRMPITVNVKEIEAEKRALEIGGIEKIENGEVPVPPDLAKEMGVRPGPDIPAASLSGNFTVQGITYTDDQLVTGIKKPVSNGTRWLVEWLIYQLLKMHYHIKRKFRGDLEIEKGKDD